MIRLSIGTEKITGVCFVCFKVTSQCGTTKAIHVQLNLVCRLSRLSLPIEDIDEMTVLNTSTPFTPRGPGIAGFGVNSIGKPASRNFDPKNSLGSLSSHSGSLSGIAESDDGEESELSNGRNGGRSSAEIGGHVEKTRLHMKSLSLQNGKLFYAFLDTSTVHFC